MLAGLSGRRRDFWSRTTLLELLGLFNSSDGTMPLYFRTTPGANVPAGTYTDVLTITWVYRFCYVGLDLLALRYVFQE